MFARSHFFSLFRNKISISCAIVMALLLVGCSYNAYPTLQSTQAETAKSSRPTPLATLTVSFTAATVTSVQLLTATPLLPPTAAASPEPRLPEKIGLGEISEVFHSPDGKIVAVGIGDELHWFDSATFDEIGSLKLRMQITEIAFSPDGQLVGVESGVSEAKVVDLKHRTVLATLTGLMGPISALSFTPDNQYVAFLMTDMRAGDFISFWNISANKAENGFEVLNPDQSHSMSGPTISPDGKLLAVGCDNQVYVWEVTGGHRKILLEGHTDNVTSVDFSPDGKWLASGSRDRTIRLWDSLTGKLIQIISGITEQVAQVEFSSDSKQLTFRTWVRPLGAWDLNTRELIGVASNIATPDPFAVHMHLRGFSQSWLPGIHNPVLFSPDGDILALASQPILLWDMTTLTVTTVLEGGERKFVTDMQYSPDGRWLAARDDAGNLRVWDARSGAMQMLIESEYSSGAGERIEIQAFAFLPDSASLAIGKQNTIDFWDVASAKLVSTIQLGQNIQSVNGLTFSSDGGQLYVILYANVSSVETWDVKQSKLLHHFELPETTGYVFGASALHGPYYARNNTDGTSFWIELWNLETGEIIFRLTTPTPQTYPIYFSPDGSLLVAISGAYLYAWDTSTGQVVVRISGQAGLSGVAISPDNQMLAIGHSGQATLWNIGQMTKDVYRSWFDELSVLFGPWKKKLWDTFCASS